MPLPSTMTPIATQTLNATAASVTFSSIPQGYTDLVLIMSIQNGTGTNYNTFGRFNGDTGTNYSDTYIYGTGAVVGSSRESNYSNGIRFGWSNSSNFSPNFAHIMNYSNTTSYKTTLNRTNDTASIVYCGVGLWRNTAAITSITLSNEASANFASGCTFTLYGVKAA